MISARSSMRYCSQQGHQEIELGLRPFPVLAAEAVERQLADAEPAALLDGGADALDAAAVALDARQAALLGPAAVAVHDDGDVPRQAGRGRGRRSTCRGRRSAQRGRSLQLSSQLHAGQRVAIATCPERRLSDPVRRLA